MNRTIKEQVETVLKLFPEARNSDRKLTIELWRYWFPEKLHRDKEDPRELWVNLEDVLNLPNQESVGRWRRKLQEQGKYLPEDKEITKKRKAHSKTWKKELGYPTQETMVPIKMSENQTQSHLRSINNRLFYRAQKRRGK